MQISRTKIFTHKKKFPTYKTLLTFLNGMVWIHLVEVTSYTSSALSQYTSKYGSLYTAIWAKLNDPRTAPGK